MRWQTVLAFSVPPALALVVLLRGWLIRRELLRRALAVEVQKGEIWAFNNTPVIVHAVHDLGVVLVTRNKDGRMVEWGETWADWRNRIKQGSATKTPYHVNQFGGHPRE